MKKLAPGDLVRFRLDDGVYDDDVGLVVCIEELHGTVHVLWPEPDLRLWSHSWLDLVRPGGLTRRRHK